MITMISGPNGVGKSSLMNFFLNESAFDYQRIRAGQKKIEEMNKVFGWDIPVPVHLTYLNGESMFRKDGYRPRMNLEFIPDRFGIQTEAPKDIQCQFILPYATIGCDEAPTWFGSRECSIENYQFSAFEKHRHHDLDIYLTGTRQVALDRRIREISRGMHVRKRKVTYGKYGITKIEWFIDLIDVGNIDAYINSSSVDKKHYYSREKITCLYDIFKIYDSQSESHLYYDGFDLKNIKLNYGRSSNV